MGHFRAGQSHTIGRPFLPSSLRHRKQPPARMTGLLEVRLSSLTISSTVRLESLTYLETISKGAKRGCRVESLTYLVFWRVVDRKTSALASLAPASVGQDNLCATHGEIPAYEFGGQDKPSEIHSAERKLVMGIRCRCGACGANLDVGTQFASRHIRCGRCRAEIVLPQGPKPRRLSVTAGLVQSPAPDQSLQEVIRPDLPGTKGSHAASNSKSRPKGKKIAKHWLGWQIAALVGGGLLAAIALVLAVVPGLFTPPPRPVVKAVLVVELPENLPQWRKPLPE